MGQLLQSYRWIYFAVFIFVMPAGVAKSDELVIGLGRISPYYIEKGDTGIFTDLIKKTFAYLPEYKLKFLYGMSNKRLWSELKVGRIDGAPNIKDFVKFDGCRSALIFRFSDIAVTWKERNIVLNSISDLSGKSIVAFQGAKNVYGNEFKRIAQSTSYRELATTREQPIILAAGRADVSVSDLYIFLDKLKTFKSDRLTPKHFTFHKILPIDQSRMGFRNPKICKIFNDALKKLKKSGEYEAIYAAYLNNRNN